MLPWLPGEYGLSMARTCLVRCNRATTSATAALNLGSSAFSFPLWTSTDSSAFFGNALKAAFSARPDSPTPDSWSSSVFVPTWLPIANARITKASHPKMAFLRCWALQRPALAARLVELSCESGECGAGIGSPSGVELTPPQRRQIELGRAERVGESASASRRIQDPLLVQRTPSRRSTQTLYLPACWLTCTTCWKVGRFCNGKSGTVTPDAAVKRFMSKQAASGFELQSEF